MAWGRIDDTYYRHRKTLALAPALRGDAIALFWTAISWSNDQLADGLITIATVRMLGWDAAIADELVRVGSWEVAGVSEWQIHDYGVYNKLRAQVLAERKAEADRQAEWRRTHPDRSRGPRVSRRDQQRDSRRDHAEEAAGLTVDNPVSQRDQRRDDPRDTQPVSPSVSLARPESRIPNPVDPESSPPPPASQGKRSNGSNPRAVGANPRATGESPRQQGTSTRQQREALKTGPTNLGAIIGELGRRAEAPPRRPNGHAPTGQGSLGFEEPS